MAATFVSCIFFPSLLSCILPGRQGRKWMKRRCEPVDVSLCRSSSSSKEEGWECAQWILKTHTNNTTRLIVHHLDHPGLPLETHACSKSVWISDVIQSSAIGMHIHFMHILPIVIIVRFNWEAGKKVEFIGVCLLWPFFSQWPFARCAITFKLFWLLFVSAFARARERGKERHFISDALFITMNLFWTHRSFFAQSHSGKAQAKGLESGWKMR